MISPSQRPLPDNTQHLQQTNIHASGGIRTHDRSKRAAVDLHLRLRSYWDRQTPLLLALICILISASGDKYKILVEYEESEQARLTCKMCATLAFLLISKVWGWFMIMKNVNLVSQLLHQAVDGKPECSHRDVECAVGGWNFNLKRIIGE